MNCVEATGIEGLSEEEADAVYLDKAKSTLLDIEIDEMLESNSESDPKE